MNAEKLIEVFNRQRVLQDSVQLIRFDTDSCSAFDKQNLEIFAKICSSQSYLVDRVLLLIVQGNSEMLNVYLKEYKEKYILQQRAIKKIISSNIGINAGYIYQLPDLPDEFYLDQKSVNYASDPKTILSKRIRLASSTSGMHSDPLQFSLQAPMSSFSPSSMDEFNLASMLSDGTDNTFENSIFDQLLGSGLESSSIISDSESGSDVAVPVTDDLSFGFYEPQKNNLVDEVCGSVPSAAVGTGDVSQMELSHHSSFFDERKDILSRVSLRAASGVECQISSPVAGISSPSALPEISGPNQGVQQYLLQENARLMIENIDLKQQLKMFYDAMANRGDHLSVNSTVLHP